MVWAVSGSRLLVLIEIEPAWRPSKLELGGLVQTRPVPVGVWGWLEASSFSSDGVLTGGLPLSFMAGGCNLWAGSRLIDLGLEAGLVQTRRVPVWVWGWLEGFSFLQSHRRERPQGGFG